MQTQGIKDVFTYVLTTTHILFILALIKTELVPRTTEERIDMGLAKYFLQINSYLNCQNVDEKDLHRPQNFCFCLEMFSTVTVICFSLPEYLFGACEDHSLPCCLKLFSGSYCNSFVCCITVIKGEDTKHIYRIYSKKGPKRSFNFGTLRVGRLVEGRCLYFFQPS